MRTITHQNTELVTTNTADTQEILLTREQAAEYFGIAKGTLEVWACTKRYNLPFVKVGRCVRYRLSDLNKFLKEQTINADVPQIA